MVFLLNQFDDGDLEVKQLLVWEYGWEALRQVVFRDRGLTGLAKIERNSQLVGL
jgi:hypothetical protein